MALTVGNIANNPDLDSPASVSFSDAYHENRGNAAWANLDDEVKEQLLRKAGDYMKAKYGVHWSTLFSTLTTVPTPIAQAAAELAFIARTTPLMPNVTRGKKKVKVGPLEVEYDGNAATSTEFVAASLRIAPYLATPVSVGPFVRLVRT